MSSLPPFPCSNKLEQRMSLEYVVHLHACAFKLLNGIHAGRTILVNPEFEQHLTERVCQYEEEIHRLKSVKFTNKGVVEL